MSRQILFSVPLVTLALVGCKDSLSDYYGDRSDPAVSSLSSESEAGNAGGQELTIQGSGFGDDPEQLVVLIGNHNAPLLSVSDTEVVVRTPRGPITGGPVDLLVATERGYLEVPDAYTYQVTSADGSAL